MSKHARIWCLTGVLMVGLVGGCVHTPSAREVEIARNRNAVAVDLMNKGQYRAALAELQIALEHNDRDPELHYNLALTYFYGFQRTEDARARLQRALELKPDYSEAENLVGVIAMEEGQFEVAIPHFRKAMDNLLYQTPYFAEQNLGWSLYRSGEVEQGLVHLRSAVAKAPDLCGAYYWLGVASEEQGDTEETVRWLEAYGRRCDLPRRTQFVPREQVAEVRFRLGMAYLKSNELQRARETFMDCLERFGQTASAGDCEKSLAVMP